MIKYTNPQFCEISGFTTEKLFGQNLRIFNSGETPPATYVAIWQALSAGQKWDGELRNSRKNGETYWSTNSISPVKSETGETTHFVSVINCIDERKRVESELVEHCHHLEALVSTRTAELSKIQDAANTANRAKSVFLANMSHGLRTLLNAVLDLSQLLQPESGLGETGRKSLTTINRAGQHLLLLINDVLEISRIEAGHSAIQFAAFDLGERLTSFEEMIRVHADSKNLIFTNKYVTELPRFVDGDGPHLKQVLINLLGNAVKYTEQGQISLRASQNNDKICFEISDTGPGIAAEDKTRIFQPFFQTNTGIAKGDGTGLGLKISLEYTRLMNGQLDGCSEPGQDCNFILNRPLPAADTRLVSPLSAGHVVALEEDQPSPRVLVVDDKADNRELVKPLLEAIGFEATRQIRTLPGGAAVKIFALTASAFEENRCEILAAGCDKMVRKPLKENRLFPIMGELLRLRYRYTEATSPALLIPTSEIDLKALPTRQIDELGHAAEMLDTDAIRRIVAQITLQHEETGRRLAALENGDRFDLITVLCEKSIHSQENKS